MAKEQVFFKTVTEDYKSLYARGDLSCTYQIGKRYLFHPDFPAHVFMRKNFDLNNVESCENLYLGREEYTGGNRVLVCYGELKIRSVPCFYIYESTWDFNNITATAKHSIFTSTDFTVTGELALPRFYGGIRPPESVKDDVTNINISPDLLSKIKMRVF